MKKVIFAKNFIISAMICYLTCPTEIDEQDTVLLINVIFLQAVCCHLTCFKGSLLVASFPSAIVHCYFEFKLHLFKNPKLFTFGVKTLFEPK